MHINDSYRKYTLFVLINEAKQMLRVAQNGLRDLEGGDFASCLDTIDLLDEDSIEDMVADIKTDTQCLIDLDSMYEYPVNDLESHHANQCVAMSASQNWREEFVDFVYQKFPLADQDLIQQLGWFLNGRLDVRRREHNPSSKITLKALIEEDIHDTLIVYFKLWTLHKGIDSTCPLCWEGVQNIKEFFESHLPEHAEEIYLLAYNPGFGRTNEKNHTDSNVTESKSTKLFSNDLSQTRKDNKASTFTKQDLLLHDRTNEEAKKEHGTMKTPDSNGHVKVPIVPASSFRKGSACISCHMRKIKCDQHRPRCQQCERRDEECSFPITKREIPRSLKKASNSRLGSRTFCHLCSDHPGGFHGEHELRRHIELAHSVNRTVWVCVDISPDKTFLANCKACKNGKWYGSMYRAAAHLRRTHFNPRKRRRGGRGEASDDDHRGGKGGGNNPPMDVLKQWMEEREEARVNDTDTGQSSEDEDALSTISSDEFPSVREEPGMLVNGTWSSMTL